MIRNDAEPRFRLDAVTQWAGADKKRSLVSAEADSAWFSRMRSPKSFFVDGAEEEVVLFLNFLCTFETHDCFNFSCKVSWRIRFADIAFSAFLWSKVCFCISCCSIQDWILCCLAVMESRNLVSSRDPFFGISVSKVSGLVSKDFGLGLELFLSRLCIGYFLWSFARRCSLKTVLKNDCSKFSPSKRSVAKLSLMLCYFARWRKQFALNPV